MKIISKYKIPIGYTRFIECQPLRHYDALVSHQNLYLYILPFIQTTPTSCPFCSWILPPFHLGVGNRNSEEKSGERSTKSNCVLFSSVFHSLHITAYDVSLLQDIHSICGYMHLFGCCKL